MQTFIRENSSGLTISLAGHGLLFLIMGMNLILVPTTAQRPVQLAIEATVIDVAEIRRRQQAEARQQQKIEEDRRRKQEAERQKQEAERQKQEQARIAEQRRKEEARREREAEQRRKAEAARLAEERRRVEAEDKRREAAERRRQEEIEAGLQRELEAEEKRLAAIESGKLAQYLALIGDRVERNWVQPGSARSGVECIVYVTQIPGGDVVNVRVGRCNGDAAVVRSIEAAVFKASPLPPPPDPSLFDRNLRFTFKPEE